MQQVVLLDLEALAEISSNPAGRQNKNVVKEAGQGKSQESKESTTAVEGKEITGLNHYFDKFMLELIKLFHTDPSLLEEKGTFIIRYVVLDWPEIVYVHLINILFFSGDFCDVMA